MFFDHHTSLTVLLKILETQEISREFTGAKSGIRKNNKRGMLSPIFFESIYSTFTATTQDHPDVIFKWLLNTHITTQHQGPPRKDE